MDFFSLVNFSELKSCEYLRNAKLHKYNLLTPEFKDIAEKPRNLEVLCFILLLSSVPYSSKPAYAVTPDKTEQTARLSIRSTLRTTNLASVLVQMQVCVHSV
jgi:hypothetical protein